MLENGHQVDERNSRIVNKKGMKIRCIAHRTQQLAQLWFKVRKSFVSWRIKSAC